MARPGVDAITRRRAARAPAPGPRRAPPCRAPAAAAAIRSRSLVGSRRRGRARRGSSGGPSPRARDTAGEVVAPVRRRTGTSRTRRTPATAPPRRPAGPWPWPRAHRLGHGRRLAHRAQPRRRRPPTSAAASPMATTPRQPGRPLPQHRQVQALVAAAGDQHGRSEALHRGQHGAGRGRLGVVVEPHPSSLAYQLHPVGEPTEGAQDARRQPSTVGPGRRPPWPAPPGRWPRRGAAAAAARRRATSTRPVEADEHPVAAPCSRRRVEHRRSPPWRPAVRAAAAAPCTTGSLGVDATATSPGPLLAQIRALAAR